MLAPLRREHAAHGLDDDLEVRQGRALLYVEQVQVHPLVEAYGVAVAAGLPVAGDAGAHEEPLRLVRVVEVGLAPEGGAGPHDGHVAPEDVQELGQLVQGGLADEAPHAGHARVVPYLEDRAVLLVELPELRQPLLGVGVHGSELEHAEGPAVPADALLHEEDGPLGVVQLDGHGHDEVDPPDEGEHEQAKGHVEGPLREAVAVPVPEALHRRAHLAVVLAAHARDAAPGGLSRTKQLCLIARGSSLLSPAASPLTHPMGRIV